MNKQFDTLPIYTIKETEMKAIVRQVYGPPEVLHLEEVVTPQPKENEILVRIRASSINLGDWELLTGHPRFISVLAYLFSGKQEYEFAPTSVTAKKNGIFSSKTKILGTDIEILIGKLV